MSERKNTILIVDDEASQRQLLDGYLQSVGYEVIGAASAEEMLKTLAHRALDLILLDVRLPGMSGMDAIPKIRELSAIPVILITAYADVRQAVTAIKQGADDYISKPVDLDELRIAIADALSSSSDLDLGSLARLPELPDEFVFRSPSMRRLVETIAVVAPSDAPVLIMGASGTGKEEVAKLIHAWSSRSDRPLVIANSAGLSETLVESELFGHTKGAFTGASEERQGLFRTADGGSLFLDEIGDMPLSLQPKLLRAVESKQVTPVGADKPIHVDTRLIAATNRDLAEETREGRFREDLYYRINVVDLVIPPIAERRDDIVPLARHFAEQFSGRPVRLSPRATQQLLTHPWNGNVRELRNAIQRACLLCRGDVILPEHLPMGMTREHKSNDASDTNRLSDIERATILATLEECGGNRTHAARKLGISRRTLIHKLHAINDQREMQDEH